MKKHILKIISGLFATSILSYGFFWMSEEYLLDNSVRTLEAEAYKGDAYNLTRNYYRALCDQVRTSYCQIEFYENLGQPTYSVPGNYITRSNFIPVLKINKVPLSIYNGNASLKISITPSIRTSLKFIFLSLLLEFLVFLIILYQQKNNELLENKKITEISKRVAHDIRGPVAALKMALNSPDQKYFLETAINRIEEISQSLVKGKFKNNLFIESFDLIQALNQIKSEKEIEFSNQLNIIISSNCEINYVLADQIELKRIFANLITNSFEAKAKILKITLKNEDSRINIDFSDDGEGISFETLKDLGNMEITTKKNTGNGLGLFHAKKLIESMNGTLSITSHGLNKGATISMMLNTSQKIINPLQNEIILLDNEKIVQIAWKKCCEKIGKKITVFSKQSDLIKHLNETNHISKEIPIYLDYNLEEDKNGLQVAKEIQKLGYSNLTLITGQEFHETEKKELVKYFKNIHGKSPPF